jgi:hypothetical protein
MFASDSGVPIFHRYTQGQELECAKEDGKGQILVRLACSSALWSLEKVEPQVRGFTRRPRQDSNLRTRLRRAVLYPLSYGGSGRGKGISAQRCG